MDGDVKWLGVVVNLDISIGFGAVFSFERKKNWRMCDPKTLGTFYWPEEKKYDPPLLPSDAIENIIEDKLTDGWNVRVKNPDGTGKISPREMANKSYRSLMQGSVLTAQERLLRDYRIRSEDFSMKKR